ncbi:MAG: homoserine kinase [Bacteroidetes bacterium]|nr:MAG: homoserine kinase [Bacteroidota bacterium]
MNNEVKILAPGTVANMVCGFDILGFALHQPADEMWMRLLPEKRVVIHPDPQYNLPTDPEKNVAGAALLAMLDAIDEPLGFEVKITKHIKPGSGIGSSAASAAGAVVGANALLGGRFSKTDLVQFAMFGEKLASGVKHADNIAPGIFGGVTLIRSILPLDVVALPSPELYVVIVHPQIEVRTADARAILRQKILLKDAIKQWGNIAGLVAGLTTKDYALIGRSLEDYLIEPVRSILIPGFDLLKQQCKAAGALGGGISGSGPSVFMLCQTEAIAHAVEKIMINLYTGLGIAHHTYCTTISNAGITTQPNNNPVFAPL